MLTGLVMKSTGLWYKVRLDDGRMFPCRVRGKFRHAGMEITNPLAVGDRVDLLLEADEKSGLITRIHERKNYIIRKSSKLSKKAQILAANIDQALLVVTLIKPLTTPVFVDRFLASAEAYRIPVILVFNKTDLYDESHLKELDNWIQVYSDIGYPCLSASVPNREGLSSLKDILTNRTSVITGHSGVGKSSLLNAMDPSLSLKTNEISDVHQAGKHTTTYPEMSSLSFGGYVIDTPGIKGFGTIDMDKEEIFHFFREIFQASSACQYHNCLHLDEPNCAVKKAVENGEISPSRYASYLNIMEEDDTKKYRM